MFSIDAYVNWEPLFLKNIPLTLEKFLIFLRNKILFDDDINNLMIDAIRSNSLFMDSFEWYKNDINYYNEFWRFGIYKMIRNFVNIWWDVIGNHQNENVGYWCSCSAKTVLSFLRIYEWNMISKTCVKESGKFHDSNFEPHQRLSIQIYFLIKSQTTFTAVAWVRKSRKINLFENAASGVAQRWKLKLHLKSVYD